MHEIGFARAARDAVVDDEASDELDEQFETAVTLDDVGDHRRAAPTRRADVAQDDLLEQAIVATEAAIADRRRLERIAAGYPELVGRRGALLIAIAALAWERGQPLHLRTQPADVARLGRLETLALRGASVTYALDEERRWR